MDIIISVYRCWYFWKYPCKLAVTSSILTDSTVISEEDSATVNRAEETFLCQIWRYDEIMLPICQSKHCQIKKETNSAVGIQHRIWLYFSCFCMSQSLLNCISYVQTIFDWRKGGKGGGVRSWNDYVTRNLCKLRLTHPLIFITLRRLCICFYSVKLFKMLFLSVFDMKLTII